MSQKFTWAEKEIFEGKVSAMMGLLEDIHRCFDGINPRKRGPNYFSDGPYMGDTLFYEQPYIKYKLQKNEDESSFKKHEESIRKVGESIENRIRQKTAPKIYIENKQQVSEQTISFNHMNEVNKFEEIPSLFSQRNQSKDNN